MKKSVTFLTIFSILLALQLAFAQAPNVDISKLSSEAVVSPLGQAAFEITLTNNQLSEDLFILELSDVAWSLSTKKTYEYTSGISLNAGESYSTTIYVKPKEDINPGTYYVELRVRSFTTKKYSSELFVITVDPRIVDYSVTVPVEVLEPTSIDPAKTNSIKVSIKNPYNVYLSNLSVKAESKFLNRESIVEISPKSEQIVDFSLNIDASTPKQEDRLSVVVKQLGKDIGSAQKTIYIKEYRQPYKADVTVTKEFLRLVHTIVFTNAEGSQKTLDASYLKPKSYAVIETNPGAVTEEFSGEQYLVWKDVTLSPNETYSVRVVEDYMPIAAGFVIIIIVLILYYTYRSPIIVNKKAFGMHKKDTGNNQIKVVLHVKNRTGKFIEKVRVLERLPIIHKVESDFGPETPEPKFRRSNEGIVLDWDIALAPKEERIFTYKVKSTLPIAGEYTLRPCVVQYGHKGRRTTSDPYRLVID